MMSTKSELLARLELLGPIQVVYRPSLPLDATEAVGLEAEGLGFDLRTLQNWEQRRNKPDAAAISLIRLFDRDPGLVHGAIYEPVS